MSKHHGARARSSHAERGRQSRAAVCDRICEALERSVGLIAAVDRERITLRTLERWLADDTEFHARYERALLSGRQHLADEIVTLADSGEGPPAVLRQRIAARKWLVMQSLRQTAKAGVQKQKEVLHPTDEEIAMMEAALKRNHDAPPEKAVEWNGALVYGPDARDSRPDLAHIGKRWGLR